MIKLIVGHYGVGKTNFALNVALDAAAQGKEVRVVDLDIVNPYFRSSEYRNLLEHAGIQLVAPVFAQAGTSLDVPSLTGAVIPAIEWAQQEAAAQRLLIVDVGGDDVGATALGRFSHVINKGPYEMLYVLNPFRNLTQEATDACEVMREIEEKSRLKVTALVSNAHLMSETSLEDINAGIVFAREVAHLTNLPIACVTLPKKLFHQFNGELKGLFDGKNLYPVESYVKTPWQ